MWILAPALIPVLALILVMGGRVEAVAQVPLTVRSADHPNFSRIVFDWPERVSYTPVLSEDTLRITFGRNAVPDFGRLQNRPLRFFGNPRYRQDEGRLVVTLDILEPGRLHHFRDGTKVAVDIIEVAPVQERATNDRGGGKAALQQKKLHQEPTSPAVAPVEVEQASLPSSSGNQPVDHEGGLLVGVEDAGNALTLTYPWPEKVRAAIFTRHDLLWVVFEKQADFDHAALRARLGKIVHEVREIDHPDATVLQYSLTPGYFVKADRKGTDWKVYLQPGYATAKLPIRNGQQRGSGHGENFFFAFEAPGSVFRLQDPVIGDELAIIPALETSQGVIKPREFTEFTVLETAQGVAVELHADRLQVTRFRNGVGIATEQGLALSKSRLSNQFDIDQGDARQTDGIEKIRLIDFRKWREGPDPASGYNPNRKDLLYRLSQSSEDERNMARWDLARFYLANGYAPDAYGILQLMLERDPELLQTPEFRAVLGVTQIHLRRYEEAVRHLTHKTLETELDAYLWRAVANEALGRDREALEDYRRGADILSLHEAADRARFVLAAIRAAYRTGDREFMNEQIKILRRYPLSAEQVTELDYWKARLTEDSGNMEKAQGEYEKVIKAGVRKTAAWARLALANLELKTGKITPAEAIDRLEKLRYAWRGDDFELRLLARLGELYVAQQEYRTGLETLKQAVTYFKRSAKTRELTTLMSDIYRKLFLEGEADKLAPIKAVALYNDFRELTPLGPAGDNMARRLADRLVSVDLLGKAAEILEHQIRYRLKGVAQADVASRLAMIYILDAKPEEALKILRATRQAQTPEDIERRRRLIEARALIQLDRFEEAEVLLQQEEGPDVDRLRADIYWNAENWPMVVQQNNKLLGRRWENPADLTLDERQTVLRLAVALSLAEDKEGLEVLRRRYMPLMERGRYAEAFEVITAQQQDSGADVRRLTQSIASVERLETFMDSYRNEFSTRPDGENSGS